MSIEYLSKIKILYSFAGQSSQYFSAIIPAMRTRPQKTSARIFALRYSLLKRTNKTVLVMTGIFLTPSVYLFAERQ